MSAYLQATQSLTNLATALESRKDSDKVGELQPSTGPYRAYDNAESPLIYIEVTSGLVTDVGISDEALHLYSPEELSIAVTMTIGCAYDMFYADTEIDNAE